MKKPLVAAAICLGITSYASAQTVRINQPDGELLLEQEKCRTSGQQATFIESRSNGGGAYGCWEVKDGYVYVHWTQMIGPTGSILNTDKVMRYLAPATLSGPTGKDKELIDRANRLNDQCRGGSGDDQQTMKACHQRDIAMEQVRKAGWCWGPDDAYSYEKRWIRCR